MAHVDDKLSAMPVPAAREGAATARPRPLRRLAGRLRALLADDGMSTRFAAERARDADLVRRVERRRP